ncbi:MAG: AAA family ATPase [Polyangiaceae bacterium]|nr:AAA family ATPase [Polyangiaceae bacterium]
MGTTRGELEVRVLGELAVLSRGRPVELPASRKTRALLAYLVLTGRSHLRTTLCELLWPGPDDPRAALRWSLSKLRAALGPGDDVFVASRDHLGIEPSRVVVDRRRIDLSAAKLSNTSLEDLEAAVKHVRGELLEGLDLADSYRFHEWCQAERASARGHHVAILGELVSRMADRPEAALKYARARVGVDPLDEAAHAEVVRLLVELGESAQADAHIQSSTRMFERELGRAPRGLLLRARVRQPVRTDKGASAELVPSVRPVATPAGPLPSNVPALVGRKDEVARIGALVTGAAGGTRCPLLLVAGEPGIGKSRLLEEVSRATLERGGRVLRGRAHEAEMIRPYGAWADALPQVREPRALSDRNRLFDALAAALEELAGSQLIAVLLDDLQWFDEASVALLHYFARAARPRVLLACSVRRAELADNVHAVRMLRSLGRAERLEEMSLSALDLSETAALARSIGGAIDTSGIFAEGGGNPLFTIEIARALARGVSGGSESLAELIDDRLERIGGSALEILPWAAALGRAFNLDVLARASGIAAGTLVGAVADLETHGVVRESATAHDYDFTHDLLRTGAYRRLSEPRRRLVHRQIALALGDPGAGGGALAADIAHHASLAGDRALCARACVAAAEHSHRVLANDEMARLALRGIESARELPAAERVRLEIELYRLCAMSGRFHGRDAEIERQVQRATEEARTLGLVAAASQGFHVLSVIQHERGDYERARVSTLEAAELGREADVVTRARQAFDTARCLANLGREMPRADALLTEALGFGVADRLDVASIEWPRGLLACWKGDHVGGEASLSRAVDAARAAQNHWVACDAGLRLAMSALDRGAYELARNLAEELEVLSEKLGKGAEAPSARALHVLARSALGDPSAAAELPVVVESLRTVDAKGMLAYTLVVSAELALDCGDVATAEARAREGSALAALVHRNDTVARARVVLGLAAAARGDQDAVAGELATARGLAATALAVSARTSERIAALEALSRP